MIGGGGLKENPSCGGWHWDPHIDNGIAAGSVSLMRRSHVDNDPGIDVEITVH